MRRMRFSSDAVRTCAPALLILLLSLAGAGVAFAQNSQNSPAGPVYVEGTICVSSDLLCDSTETYSNSADIKLKGIIPTIYFENTGAAQHDNREWFIRTDVNRFRLHDHGSSGNVNVEVLAVESGAPAYSLHIDSSGNIGLGTNSPAKALHIQQGGFPAIRIQNEVKSWHIEADHISYAIYDPDNDTRPFEIKPSAPNHSLIITSSGNLGFGTPSPTEAVDVIRSGAAARFQLTSHTNDPAQAPQFIQRRSRGTVETPTAVLANDNLGLFSFRGYNGTSMTGSKATITVQAAGNWTAGSNPTRILFGTTPVGSTTVSSVMEITPDKKVKINGATLNVPDYVFKDDYQLMPLDQLQDFIDRNGHLPGIASADEVQAEGLDLAGSQMSQLQKIEELTLYTLQQERSLLALRAENAELRSRVEQVEQLKEMVAMLMQERDFSPALAASDP